MGPQDAQIPYRYITRCLVEFQMESLRLALRVFPGDLHRAMIFALVARMASADWVREEHLSKPEHYTPFSINSLASSLRRPFETVRRHINAMISDGICAKTPQGIILAPSTNRNADIIGYYAHQVALLSRLVRKLTEHDIPLPQPERPEQKQLCARVNASLDLALVALENNEYENWYELIIHGTLIHESGIDVMNSDALSRKYANIVIPDELWRPVKIRQIAEKYGMPYATMRRHFLAMQAEGALFKKRSGYTLSTKWTAEPDRIAMSDRNVQYLLRHLRTLSTAGIDLLEPAIAIAT